MISQSSVAEACESGQRLDQVIEAATEDGPNSETEYLGHLVENGPPAETLPVDAYKVSLVLVKSKGTLVTRVLDSRFDDIDEAWEGMGNSEGIDDTVYRLVVAEDLPGETEALLERVLHGDRRILIDHAANRGHTIQCWEEHRLQNPKTEFHVNVSEPPTAVSIALPYEIHGKPNRPLGEVTQLVDHTVDKTTCDRMESAVEWMEMQPCGLRTSWLTVPPRDPDIQRLLYVAYRRISIQHISKDDKKPPTCVFLLYPPLLRLRAKGAMLKIPADLVYPSTSPPTNMSGEIPTNKIGSHEIPRVSASLIRHFETQLGPGDHTSSVVQTMISSWMVLNTQATFRESINSSVEYWCFVSSMTRERPHDIGEVIEGNRDLLGRFREAITVKLRQLEKARAESTWLTRTGKFDSDTEIQLRQGWKRLDLSLDPILADVEKLLQKRATDLQRRMTNIQIEESRTAIQQAETVKRLTRLAFIFIPMSATCSAFGMNVQELIQGPPPVWISILVMLGVTITTIVCSLETTHNIFWAIAYMLESLTPRQLTKASMSPKTVWKKVVEVFVCPRNDGAISPWLPNYSSMRSEKPSLPSRLIFKLARLVLDLCQIPWLAVERLAWVGAQYKKRREEIRLSGHAQDKDLRT